MRADTVIAGLGKSGVSCGHFLRRRGLPFRFVDDDPGAAHTAAIRRQFPAVEIGSGEVAELDHAARLLISPGISLDGPLACQARALALPVIGDIELFARNACVPYVAVTGSNGKSTVVSLLVAMAEAAGKNAIAGGNIGVPALDLLDTQADLYVLELSSFQLETTRSLAPYVACVLNVSEDHRDRHPDMALYAALKRRIYQRAYCAVVNRDDRLAWSGSTWAAAEVRAFQEGRPAVGEYGIVNDADGESCFFFGRQRLMAVADMRLPAHAASNALAAMAIADTLAWPRPAQLQALRCFEGLPHRCQKLACHQGIYWYNDSKATNVAAAVAAIKSMPGPLLWIAGGAEKQADFTPLRTVLQGKLKAAFLLGHERQRLADHLAGLAPCHLVDSLPEAVQEAAKQAVAGDRVLFSPACASVDMFRNFAHRGDCFCESVQAVIA